ncbi:MAG: SsrA-binding protein SmpB [Alphaproteobacteria bacterium]|nr:SsrA-binding protein SmpB [Alphaproteobacteria bacterium]
MAGKESSSSITVANNRKAFANYAIEEELEAGLALTGTEVKSLRAGKANIADAYAGPKGEELWLFNATIAPYAGGNRFNHEERRPRKLLLHRRQINKLIGRLKVKGVTLVPLALYFNSRGIAKIKLGLGTGKKEYEKRDTIKQRDWQKDKARIMREKNR